MSDYTGRALELGKRCYNTAFEQRQKDITMPHPLTGADITEPWYYFERVYRGFQYDFVTKMASWASMPASNKTFSGIEAYATMLCDSKPAITLVPREPADEKFVAIAKAGLSYWWDAESMENTIASAVKASRIYGTAWFHTYYDEDQDTMKCEAIHPSHVLVDPNCTSSNFDPSYLIYEYKAQYGSLRDKYDGKTLEDGSTVNFSQFSRNRNWMLSTYSPDASDQRWQDPIQPTTTVNVYELHYKDPEKVIWEDEEDGMIVTKSKKKYPNGRVFIYAGGMLISDKANPYKHGEFPFTPLFAYTMPGRFYGIGDVQMVLNIQVMRNRFAQLIIDMTMKSGGGWMFLGQGSGLKPHQISQGPFNIVPCKDVNQVRIERPPAPSRHVFDFIQVLDMDFDDTMGIHEISRGATLTSHKTAQEIAVMAESDRTRVRQAARNLIWSLKRVTRQVMYGLAQFHEGDWFLRIHGDFGDVTPMEGAPDEEVETVGIDAEFNGKMLLANDGEKLKYDIVFADDATLPNSQSETFSKIQGLLQMGVITPDDVLKYKLVDIPYAEQILQDRERMNKQAAEQAAAVPDMGAVPPEMGGMPPVDMTGMGGGMPPELGGMPMGGSPDLAALLGAGGGGMPMLPPGMAAGPAGDPMTDMMMQMGLGDTGSSQIPPELLAQLTGGAAVPIAPEPGTDPLSALGLGDSPVPMGGIDQSLMNALKPAGSDMPIEQIIALVQQLSKEYGIPVEQILQLLMQSGAINPDEFGGMMPGAV